MKGKPLLPAHLNHVEWNRRILNFFWAIVVVSGCVELINSLFTARPLKEFYIQYLVLPTLLLSLVTLLGEWAYKKNGKYTDYIIIGSASLLAGVLIGIHSEMEVLYSSLFYPLLISTIYFEKKKVWFSFGLNLSIYLLLSSLHPVVRALNDSIDRISMVCILLTAVFVCLGMMRRGYEFAQYLKKAQEDHQDLMVKSTIMEKQVKMDALTGLYNHMAFYEYMDVLMLQAETYQYPMHLAVMDIDNFKYINDTYGHGVGDQVLKRIAKAIKENVSTDDFVARYGGEEFVVILNDVSEEQAFAMLEKIRNVVQMLNHPEIPGEMVTISIGLQTYRPRMHKQAFFEGADNSLYAAKRKGKNRIVFQELKEAIKI
jgi:diguanylate cyclase (GGDEF)-like protein